MLLMPFIAKGQGLYDYKDLYNKPTLSGGDNYLDSLFHAYFNEAMLADSIDEGGYVIFSVEINKEGYVNKITLEMNEMPKGIAEECKRVLNLIAETEIYEVGKIKRKSVEYAKQERISFYKCEDAEVGLVYFVNSCIDKMPVLPGGEAEMRRFVKANFRTPKNVWEFGAYGKIVVGFIIDEAGKMTDIEIEKDGVGLGCAEEALRVVQLMAENYTWTVGEHDGCLIKVKYHFPIVINQQ